jgi:two-component system, sensor histidine kinase PdtaS
MAHEHTLSTVTGFVCPAFGHVEWRTVASYEHELAERRGTEIRLRRALAREKALLRQKDELLKQCEILSREADHRLMNGLQMVVSLLSLQSRGEANARAAAHLSSAANRVATIARIHSRLHSLDGLEAVAFKRFIDELCHDYSAMLIAEDRRNQGIVVEGVEALLPAATAIPLSLITTELITNAVKHGRGAITVRLEAPAEGGGHVLSVCNDGPALPQDFNPAAGEGLGVKIVLALVEQIGGTLQVARCAQCQGSRFAVAFI